MVGVGWDETLDRLVKCIHICELERKGGEQTKGGGKKRGYRNGTEGGIGLRNHPPDASGNSQEDESGQDTGACSVSGIDFGWLLRLVVTLVVTGIRITLTGTRLTVCGTGGLLFVPQVRLDDFQRSHLFADSGLRCTPVRSLSPVETTGVVWAIALEGCCLCGFPEQGVNLLDGVGGNNHGCGHPAGHVSLERTLVIVAVSLRFTSDFNHDALGIFLGKEDFEALNKAEQTLFPYGVLIGLHVKMC
ncbi:hypothetical protein H106_08621 [Trichophyton rubrum CBS 735.88]|nr:hypothetical protein H106_08621 [Trichophyton rubrum CBS 735.88]